MCIFISILSWFASRLWSCPWPPCVQVLPRLPPNRGQKATPAPPGLLTVCRGASPVMAHVKFFAILLWKVLLYKILIQSNVEKIAKITYITWEQFSGLLEDVCFISALHCWVLEILCICEGFLKSYWQRIKIFPVFSLPPGAQLQYSSLVLLDTCVQEVDANSG